MKLVALACLTVLGVSIWAPSPALAHSHLWRIREIFSDASGMVQFVEMCEIAGSNVEGHLATDFTFLESETKRYFFPSDIGVNPDISAFRCVLTASPGFVGLPGAPTPDYVLDADLLPFFFGLDGDTVTYGRVIADYSVVPVPVGTVPSDGIMSVHFDHLGNATIGVNDPKNFAGETGSIDLSASSPVPLTPPGLAGALTLLCLLVIARASTRGRATAR